jgi:hypothetical protein
MKVVATGRLNVSDGLFVFEPKYCRVMKCEQTLAIKHW